MAVLPPDPVFCMRSSDMGAVNCICFHSTERLFSGTAKGAVYLWDMQVIYAFDVLHGINPYQLTLMPIINPLTRIRAQCNFQFQFIRSQSFISILLNQTDMSIAITFFHWQRTGHINLSWRRNIGDTTKRRHT